MRISCNSIVDLSGFADIHNSEPFQEYSGKFLGAMASLSD